MPPLSHYFYSTLGSEPTYMTLLLNVKNVWCWREIDLCWVDCHNLHHVYADERELLLPATITITAQQQMEASHEQRTHT